MEKTQVYPINSNPWRAYINQAGHMEAQQVRIAKFFCDNGSNTLSYHYYDNPTDVTDCRTWSCGYKDLFDTAKEAIEALRQKLQDELNAEVRKRTETLASSITVLAWGEKKVK